MQAHTPDHVVLIADNDAAVNSLLTELLTDAGLTCVSVQDGVEALERLRRGGIDVLVTDLDMPNLDGRQLLRELSGIQPTPDVFVISGYLGAAVESSLRADPAVRDVLHKPFDLLEFAVQVRDVIAARRGPRAMEA
jgi:CheY-like chemotaxis protein